MNHQSRHPGFLSPVMQTRNRIFGGAYQLGGSNARNTVTDARSRLQEHYNLQAQVAAEKRKEKERKKKMEWLERQEKLVKPGHVLGTSDESSSEAKLHCDPQKERKKKMEWLERQEKLVKPGHVLGTSDESSSEAKLHCDPQKERKKRMEWLERQEKLVKPGHVLGTSDESSSEAKLNCESQNSDEVIAAAGQCSADEDSETQRDYRSEMAAARARFQERYNATLRQTTSQLQKVSIAGEK